MVRKHPFEKEIRMNTYMSIGMELIIGFLLLVGIYRFMGNKEFSQITPIDMVFVVSLADMVVSISLSSEFHVFHMVFSMLLWTMLIYTKQRINKKSKKASSLAQGEVKIIIKNEKVIDSVIEEEQINNRELETLLRNVGVWDVKDVEIGILEINGKINCKLKNNR